jgi:hypothetical protein
VAAAFSWERTARQHLDFYDRVLSTGGPAFEVGRAS